MVICDYIEYVKLIHICIPIHILYDKYQRNIKMFIEIKIELCFFNIFNLKKRQNNVLNIYINININIY